MNINWTRIGWLIAGLVIAFGVLSLMLFIWISWPAGGSFSVTPA